MSSRALLIGIDYLTIPKSTLRGCINDVLNINDMLTKEYQYLPSNITILRDDNPIPETQPTYDNIITQLTQLVEISGQCKEIFIHYSGHGTQNPNKYSIDGDGFDEAIVPIDYMKRGFINDILLFSIIKNLKCPTIILMDCCASATLFDLEWNFSYNSNNVLQKMQIPQHYVSNPNVFVFSGCKDFQNSMDIYDRATKKHVGAMTKAFLECLKQSGYTSSMTKLYTDIAKYMRSQNFVQHPCFSTTHYAPSYYLIHPSVREVVSYKSPAVIQPEPTPTKTRVAFYSMKNIMKSTLTTGAK